MFDFQDHREKMSRVVDIIKRRADAKASLRSSTIYTDEVKAQQLATNDKIHAGEIDKLFAAIKDDVDRDLTAAAKKAQGPSVDYAERQYHALAAQQDVTARSGDHRQLLALYKETAESGNRIRLKELERLLDPILAGGETLVPWLDAKQSTMTEEETTAAAAQATGARYKELLSSVQNFANSLMSDSENIAPDSLITVFDSARAKIEGPVAPTG